MFRAGVYDKVEVAQRNSANGSGKFKLKSDLIGI